LSSGNTGNDPLILNTGGGNVGIGTDVPNAPLEVKNAGAVQQRYTRDANSTDISLSSSGMLNADNLSSAGFGWYNNGTEAMRIDGVGNIRTPSGNDLTIGQYASPAHTAGNVGSVALTISDGGGNSGVFVNNTYDGTYSSQNITFKTAEGGLSSATERMRIDASGNLLVGTTSAGALASPNRGLIDINGTSDSALEFKTAGVTHGYLYESGSEFRVANLTAHPLTFYTSNNERMRIDASGNLLVGRTSTASAATDYGTQVYSNGVIYQFAGATGNSDIHRWHNGAGTKVAYLQGDGDLIITGTYSPSDERLKENIVDAPAGNLDDLRVRSYDWKADGSSVTHGFIAQELEVVAPYAVTKGETEDDMMAVDYSKLVPMMVKEIQDLKAEVAALKGA
jgi:hypothetical protein